MRTDLPRYREESYVDLHCLEDVIDCFSMGILVPKALSIEILNKSQRI